MRFLKKPKTDMILWMQIQFVVVAMSILVGVFLVMLSSINMIMQTVSQSQSHGLLVQIGESDRYNSVEMQVPPELPPEIPTEMAPSAELPDRVLTAQPMANWWEEDEEENNNTEENNWGNWWEDEERPTKPEWEETDETRPPPPWMTETTPVQTTVAPTDPPTEQVTATPAPSTQPPTAPPTDPPETTTTTETSTTTTTTITTNATTTTTTVTTPPPPPSEDRGNKWEVTIMLDHFAIMADHNGAYLGIRNTENYTDEQAQVIMERILQKGESSGMYGWLQYYVTEKPYGTLIVLTDKTSDQGLLNNLFRTTVIVGVLMLLVLLATLCVLSKWITQPVRDAFARQKQFVSDAGHELKTPLTILSANADLLQDEIGENRWLGYMQEQTSRMNQLVGDLLSLARMDNATQKFEMAEFDLSTAINATVLPFEGQAFEMHKNLEMDVQPNLRYCGSEQHIRQLAAIFLDNAMKYSDENGVIKVTLLQRGEDRILEFYNTGCEISQSESDKIFERFYRGDKARKNAGKSGYGLGLAIAKGIMDVHKIKIQVTCEQGKWIRFLLTM